MYSFFLEKKLLASEDQLQRFDILSFSRRILSLFEIGIHDYRTY